jgi:hypothetical protein
MIDVALHSDFMDLVPVRIVSDEPTFVWMSILIILYRSEDFP